MSKKLKGFFFYKRLNRKEVKKSEKESKKNYIGSFSSGHVMWNHSG